MRRLRSVLASGLLDGLLPNGAAIGAFLLFLGPVLAALGWALIALALGFVAWRGYRSKRPVYATPRVVALCAIGVLYAREVPERTALLAVALGIALLLTVNESTLRRLPSGGPPALNLPGLAPAPRTARADAVFWVNVVATAAIAAGALAEAPTWVPFAVAVVAGAAVVAFVLSAVRQRRRAGQELSDVRDALEALAPTFAVHFSGSPGAAYQVGMWLPYLDRVGEPYVILVRERHSALALAELTERPVIICSTLAALDAAVVPSLRAMFYVNNGMKNTHSVRFAHLTHVQLLHGDSDKPPSFSPVTAMYDRVFVAGQAGIDRYAANGVSIPPERFVIVGRPQVEAIRIADRPIGGVADPTVLYAPTWQGHYADSNFCSLPVADHLIAALLQRRVRVIMRPHPYSAKDRESAAQIARVEAMLAEDARNGGPAHLWGASASADISLFECFDLSDALLSDVSSVVSDYLYSQKPFAVTDMLDQGEEFAAAFPVARAAYVVRRDLANLDDVLDGLLRTDPLAPVRRDMRAYYLGNFAPESYAEAFFSAARDAIHAPQVLPAPAFVPEND